VSLAGATWGARPSPVTTALFALSMGDASVGYAVGAAGTVVRTGNGGLTWARRATGLPSSTTLRAVFAKVALVGNQLVDFVVAAGDGGLIVSSEDGGATWTTHQSCTTNTLHAVYVEYQVRVCCVCVCVWALSGCCCVGSPNVAPRAQGCVFWDVARCHRGIETRARARELPQ